MSIPFELKINSFDSQIDSFQMVLCIIFNGMRSYGVHITGDAIEKIILEISAPFMPHFTLFGNHQ